MDNKAWAQEVAKKIKEKELAVAKRNVGKVPYTAENGVFNDCSGKEIGWWTNGFWGGMMWQLYQATNEPVYKESAEELEKKLDAALMNYHVMDHDSGFRWLPTAVANYRQFGSDESKNRGMLAASNLAGRYNAKGEFIVAWNSRPNHQVDGWAIIDCMMNLPLLFWASEATGHPFYKRIATMHADTTMKNFVRSDYSVMHAFRFSEETGKATGEANYCGYSCGSHWARGAAWAIYGFAIAFRYTGKTEYLDVATALLDKFMTECKEKIPAWDFRLPDGAEKAVDTSAAAIVLCGICELEKHKKTENFERYKRTLRNNLEEYINYDEDVMGILGEQDGAHLYASYGDYFLIESYVKENSKINVW